MEHVEIKSLGPEDVLLAQKLFLVLQNIFEVEKPSSPSLSYLGKLLRDYKFIVYAAVQGEEILGGLTAYELPLYRAASSEIFCMILPLNRSFNEGELGGNCFQLSWNLVGKMDLRTCLCLPTKKIQML